MMLHILGRQPELGLAELNSLYGSARMFGREAAITDSSDFDIQSVGGVQKSGNITMEIPHTNWPAINKAIFSHYYKIWSKSNKKITLGISVYGSTNIRPKQINALSQSLKQALKKSDISVRTIPNKSAALNTATSHHNKLGLNPHKIELIIAQDSSRTLVAESTGAQNITALAKRDQGRPKRDAFVGMLPPKLALMMINMAAGSKSNKQRVSSTPTLLDPFCGTGVILQEALLQGYSVYGSDLSDKMISYSKTNLDWLQNTHRTKGKIIHLHQSDATNAKWKNPSDISLVVCEAYLGQPFSATPSSSKLKEVRGNCNSIISSFLKNIGEQIQPGTKFTVAVPAWRDLNTKRITRLPLVKQLDNLGYSQINTQPLLYYRDDQIVARDILVFEKN
ncbi:methyltransferase domain-containing protein [Candidatus Saccharibacteria bacterium]|nr:methyltransferase domain-containing protein [Candidatus Saccharibacteria bacterium]